MSIARTNEAAMQWLLGALGAPYVQWTGGEVSPTDGPPAWADNGPLPDISRVLREGGFCIAAINLMIRKRGGTIPNPFNDERWDGGTLSSYDHFYDSSQWFNPDANYADFWFLLSPYKQDGWGNMIQEGHGAITYQGYTVEWIINGGLTWKFTIPESHWGWGNYEIAIPPEVWLPKEFSQQPTITPGLNIYRRPQLTIDHVAAIMPNARANGLDNEWHDFIKTCHDYEINTKNRLAAFLMNVAKESGELYYVEEIADGWDYEWRKDLGNTHLGDGPRYKGHGYIQTTGRLNHRKVGEALGINAEANPELLCQMPYAWYSAGWYWRYGSSWGNLNDYADAQDWYHTIVGVRGADDPDRYIYLHRALIALPNDIILPPPFDPPVNDEPIAPEGEPMLNLAKYNFVAKTDQYAIDFANAAVMALEANGIEAMAFNSDYNIMNAAIHAKAGEEVIIVGEAATNYIQSLDLDPPVYFGWSDNDVVWHIDQIGALETLNFLRNWVFKWIALTDATGESIHNIQPLFDRYLDNTNPQYTILLTKLLDTDNLPPPPPEPVMEELWIPAKDVRDTDKVKVYRKKGPS